jgi:putative transposase
VSPQSKLSMRKQCELLTLNRSTLYYEAVPAKQDDVELMNVIRDIWEKRPFYGYRRITPSLLVMGYTVGYKRVKRLMKEAGIKAIYPGPNTSRRHHKAIVRPYLLKDWVPIAANGAWMVDITYLRLAQGFVYLVALIDVHSRYVVGWELSNTMSTTFCLEAFNMAKKLGTPVVVNTDQGSQFTSEAWLKSLTEKGILVSMTGKGRCLDNVYIERFWRSVKQEEFYLNEYTSVKALRQAIAQYIEFYNNERFHQSLEYQTPASVYFRNRGDKESVDIWTNPSGRSAPFGTCGQGMDSASATHTLPTFANLSPTYPQMQQQEIFLH